MAFSGYDLIGYVLLDVVLSELTSGTESLQVHVNYLLALTLEDSGNTFFEVFERNFDEGGGGT